MALTEKVGEAQAKLDSVVAEIDFGAVRRLYPMLRPREVKNATGIREGRLHQIFHKGGAPTPGEAAVLGDFCGELQRLAAAVSAR